MGSQGGKMNDNNNSKSDYPQAEIRQKSRFSLVWLIPIVALFVGAFMVFQAIVTKGPLITISFSKASGLVAGKTELRYKDVTVGLVESIHLNDDLSAVIVEARMDKSIEPYLLDSTQFWVETARISAGEISGLGTLFSGAYIAMDPGEGKETKSFFKGQNNPPVVTTGQSGRHFILEAQTLGSITVKTPVYYRQIKVGEVVSYQLREDGKGVQAQIFVNAPYEQFVKKSSRFWNASGIDLKLDSKGININTESLTSLLYGGIAFETPVGFEQESEAEAGHLFPLFTNYEKSKEKRFYNRNYYFAYFPHSIRGLEPGASVEFLGFKVGEVVDMKLELDVDQVKFLTPVLFYIEPERVEVRTGREFGSRELMETMVGRGLRAQLKNANLLTGQLYIDLVLDEKAKKQKIDYSLAHPLLPTIPSDVEALSSSVLAILDGLREIKFKQLGDDLGVSLNRLNSTLEKSDHFFEKLNSQTTVQIGTTLQELRVALDDMRNSFGQDSDLNHDARVVLSELSEASRSIKVLTDYLANHPEALLRGKEQSE
jgi:paraquat-inducible protein B